MPDYLADLDSRVHVFRFGDALTPARRKRSALLLAGCNQSYVFALNDLADVTPTSHITCISCWLVVRAGGLIRMGT